jgi:ribose transport system substrate-binding protein
VNTGLDQPLLVPVKKGGYTAPVKLLVRIGIILFALLSVLALSVSLTLVRRMYIRDTEPPGPGPKYHFALYLPENRDSFFLRIIQGAERAAEEAGVVLTFHSIDPDKNELAMASYSGVDGVVVCPYIDERLARRQLEKLATKKIPLVLINHNIPSDQPWPYIGTNSFDIGRRMGTVIARMAVPPLRLAVVYSDKSPGILGEKELVEMGITAVLEGSLAAPIVGLRTGLNPLDAEELIYRLFRTDTRINTIVFTDSADTIAAAQALIDMNLVGRVQLIGFGKEPAILEYIRKEILAGSIAVNPELIGYEAIRSLMELRTTGYTSTSVDTGVEIVDRSSL